MKTIILTGCNKGIGYGILERLVTQEFKIIMACRNTELAEKAKQQVIANGTKSEVHIMSLDISNKESINQFVQNFQNTFKTCDILLNNAGMAYKGDAFGVDVVETTFETNYFGTVRLLTQMLPLINEHGKIINVASKVGVFTIVSEELKRRFQSGENLDHLYEEYLTAIKEEKVEEKGWKKWGYANSKLFLNVFTTRLAKLDIIQKNDIQVYSMCPGWIHTDMAGPKAPGTIQEGAETPMYLVNLPHKIDPALQGGFFQKCALSEY